MLGRIPSVLRFPLHHGAPSPGVWAGLWTGGSAPLWLGHITQDPSYGLWPPCCLVWEAGTWGASRADSNPQLTARRKVDFSTETSGNSVLPATNELGKGPEPQMPSQPRLLCFQPDWRTQPTHLQTCGPLRQWDDVCVLFKGTEFVVICHAVSQHTTPYTPGSRFFVFLNCFRFVGFFSDFIFLPLLV